MAATARVFGSSVRLRSGLVWQDGFGDVSLLLAPHRTTCASLSSTRTGAYVWAWVHSTGPALRIGRKVTGAGRVRVVVNFAEKSGRRTVSLDRHVGLVVTRIETGAHGVWHGRLQVRATTVHGARFGVAGTFSARWCGLR